jgi:hypothetical protein
MSYRSGEQQKLSLPHSRHVIPDLIGIQVFVGISSMGESVELIQVFAGILQRANLRSKIYLEDSYC